MRAEVVTDVGGLRWRATLVDTAVEIYRRDDGRWVHVGDATLEDGQLQGRADLTTPECSSAEVYAELTSELQFALEN